MSACGYHFNKEGILVIDICFDPIIIPSTPTIPATPAHIRPTPVDEYYYGSPTLTTAVDALWEGSKDPGRHSCDEIGDTARGRGTQQKLGYTGETGKRVVAATYVKYCEEQGNWPSKFCSCAKAQPDEYYDQFRADVPAPPATNDVAYRPFTSSELKNRDILNQLDSFNFERSFFLQQATRVAKENFERTNPYNKPITTTPVVTPPTTTPIAVVASASLPFATLGPQSAPTQAAKTASEFEKLLSKPRVSEFERLLQKPMQSTFETVARAGARTIPIAARVAAGLLTASELFLGLLIPSSIGNEGDVRVRKNPKPPANPTRNNRVNTPTSKPLAKPLTYIQPDLSPLAEVVVIGRKPTGDRQSTPRRLSSPNSTGIPDSFVDYIMRGLRNPRGRSRPKTGSSPLAFTDGDYAPTTTKKPSPIRSASPSTLTAFQGQGLDCLCPKATRTKSKPRKKRTKCFKGGYVETASGLLKSPKEEIPCQ
jgi:hypothetical protein